MAKFLPVGKEDPMATMVRMVINTKYEDLPADVVNYARRSIMDTIGVIIGGSGMEGIPTIVNFVKENGGKPESFIPFYGGKVPRGEAAFAIAPMARAIDLGDVHEEASHSSEYTVPAMLAAGLNPSGKDLITAYTVGQEVLIRIGIAYRANIEGVKFGRRGGHSIFGVVAALGKLFNMTQEQLENAEGMGSVMTQPHSTSILKPATLTVRMQHGFLCQAAMNCCLLAQKGITGPRKEVLSAPNGYFGFAKWETDPAALTKGLGEEWEMMTTSMKRFASRKPTHTVIDALLESMQENNFKADDIARIDVDVSTADGVSLSATREAQWNPQTIPECQFSLPYVVATAACTGDVFIDSYTPEARANPKVRDLMTRITIKEDKRLETWSARANTTLKNGRKFSKVCVYPKGHPKQPLTNEELISKFKRCAAYSVYKLSEKTVDSVVDSLMNLEKVKNFTDAIIVPMTPR
jgi:2-methylcitrate dehydratase PrpD